MWHQEWKCITEIGNLRADINKFDGVVENIIEQAFNTEDDKEARFLLYVAGTAAESVESARFIADGVQRATHTLGPKWDANDFTAGYNSGLDAGYLGRLAEAKFRMEQALHVAEYFIAVMSDYKNGHLGPAAMRVTVQRLLRRTDTSRAIDKLL